MKTDRVPWNWRVFRLHACWLDSDCRSVGVPAHTYLTLFGWTWRINPPFSRRYFILRDEPPKLRIGTGWTWRVLQYIGHAKSMRQIKEDIRRNREDFK